MLYSSHCSSVWKLLLGFLWYSIQKGSCCCSHNEFCLEIRGTVWFVDNFVSNLDGHKAHLVNHEEGSFKLSIHSPEWSVMAV